MKTALHSTRIAPFGLVLALVSTLASTLVACGAPAANAPKAACQDQPGGMALGFEHAKVGANELPIAIFCGMRGDEPTPQATSVEASFTSTLAGAAPVKGEVVYRRAARVLEGGGDRMQFDYVIKVIFDRAGTWVMQLRARVPWRSEEVQHTFAIPVVDAPANQTARAAQ